MVIKCLECNYKCGNIACLKYHYESCHKDKIDKCICGNITISAICADDFSPWGCSLKNESNSSSNTNSNSNSNSISSSSPSSNSSSNPSSSSGSGSIYDFNSNSDPNLIPNPNPSSEELTRCCNKCNYIKPLNNFDEGKYTCRSCTSAKINCPYCTSVVRYDGIWAHVKKQHPDIELTRGFSRNLQSRFPDLSGKKQSSRTVSPLVNKQAENLGTSLVNHEQSSLGTMTKLFTDLGTSFADSCSCKYYDFVLFLINNGINIEKVKENINLLKSVDTLK